MTAAGAPPVAPLAGVLLAAGTGTRFGGDKLLARIPTGGALPGDDGATIAAAACRHLVAVVPWTIAVVRPGADALAAVLAAAGARVVACPEAEKGMGESLACAVRATAAAGGWVVALADMPWVAPATIARVAAAIAGGAAAAAPFHRGERGHPVGFGRECYAALAGLRGDTGAKAVVAALGDRLLRLDVDDPGVRRDVDTPADLA
jgi:molybdenum cofactor cytidylyltransferase